MYSNNKNSSFCGSRFPWVYDALDTKLRIILMTQRFGTEKCHLEMQYYGASRYVPHKEHFVLFIQPSSILNMHFPNIKQNAYESFHFISSGRLDILQLDALNMCSNEQVACYDGPGIKSPLLQFTYIQLKWACLSSTFQMLCQFTRADCAKTPHLQYHAMRARNHQVKHLVHITTQPKWGEVLQIHESASKGTTKYVYLHHANITAMMQIFERNISFPYMLYEGNSCLYGGVYIVQTSSSKDSEILSLCTPVKYHKIFSVMIEDLSNVSVVIIHYREYSTDRIEFHARYSRLLWNYNKLSFNSTYVEEKTLRITVPTLIYNVYRILIHSFDLNLRKMQHVNITFDSKDMLRAELKGNCQYELSCLYITVFYTPHPSNIAGRQYDVETMELLMLQRGIIRYGSIKTIVISTRNAFDIPTWEVRIRKFSYTSLHSSFNAIHYQFMPAGVLHWTIKYRRAFQLGDGHKPWVLVHMVKPDSIVPQAMWRVWIDIADIDTVSHVSLEVDLDDNRSSSVYEWNNVKNSDNVYMTVDKAVNILFESNYSVINLYRRDPFSVWFIRNFIHDDRVTEYAVGQTPQNSYYTFHNHR